MFRTKKLAPAAIFSMTDQDVVRYNKSKTKEALITAGVMVAGIAASIVLADAITKVADKKLREHYAPEND